MIPADAFREAARSFKGGTFTKEQLAEEYYQLVDGGRDDTHFKAYFTSFQRKAWKGLKIKSVKPGSNLYAVGSSAPTPRVSRKPARRKKASRGVRPLPINPDLPKSVTITGGVVDITPSNVSIVHNAVMTSDAYGYTNFVQRAFESTRPTPTRPLTVEDIIHRLVIINQIDSVNLDKTFGTGCFQALADSIYMSNIEGDIAARGPISNRKFSSIALRMPVAAKANPLKLFSAITKYIARTAQYVYSVEDGYPIYDGVLGKALPLYIPGIKISAIKKNCDYEQYCIVVNDYLKSVNAKIAPAHISNVAFDQLVWYSYKKPSAARKYR